MTKDEALDLALEALEYIHEGANNQGPHTGISWRCVSVKAEPAIKAIKQARALDKMAENARELGLDYEPVPDPDYWPGTKPVQEPVWIQPDHLQKAKTAPFLCRVEPHKRDDFVPLYPAPPAQRQWVEVEQIKWEGNKLIAKLKENA